MVGSDGKPIWRSPSLEDPSGFSLEPVDTGRWLFSSEPEFRLGFGVSWLIGKGESRKFTVFVSEDRSEYSAQLRIYRRTLAHWLGVTAVLVLTALLALLHWVLIPLKEMVGELTEIQAGKREGIGEGYPLELRPLGEGLNSLLRHERAHQRRYRHALDDLAHALKTPLAALRASGDPRVSETVDQIGRTLDYQVRKASTAGRTIFTKSLPLRPLAERVVSALAKVYREKNVTFEILIDESVVVPVEEGDLMELLGNLLDNGAKWCQGKVAVTGGVEEGRFRLAVEDDGPGFPKEKGEELLKRGVRADRKMPGEGIGLAVVSEVVALYEGEIRLEKSAMGGGKVDVSIPM